MSQAYKRKLAAATPWCIGIGILSMACASLVHAADDGGQFYGLLRSRDLSPFGFLRLDMRPAHAVSIAPGSWAIETEIGYQNTWALSPEVEKYLIGLEQTGRRRIGPARSAGNPGSARQPLQSWRLSLEGAVKIPVDGRRLLLSTGRTDYGVQASLQRPSNHHAFYADLAAVYYAGATQPAGVREPERLFARGDGSR